MGDYIHELCEAVEGKTVDEVVEELAGSSRKIRDPEAFAAYLLAGAPGRAG